jgi:hypothetical protein
LGQPVYAQKDIPQFAQQAMQHNGDRAMSVEMADVSALSLQSGATQRHCSADGERMREKAREAQEQVNNVDIFINAH